MLFRRTAFAAAALVFVVIVASAFMRHTQAGLACDDWPACYGRIAAASASPAAANATGTSTPGTASMDATPSTGVRVARLAHRLAATGVLALVIGMLLVAWTQRPPWTHEGVLSAAALVVAGALAVLGVATPGATLPAVTLGNLLGGYAMLALLAATWACAGRDATGAGEHTSTDAASTAGSASLPFFVFCALVLVFAQAWLGGMIGAQYALTTCPTLGACPAPAHGTFSATGAFDLFRPLSVAAGQVVPPADATVLHLAHRLVGILLVIAALVAAHALRRTARQVARLLVRLVLATLALGIASILGMPSLPLAVLHNAAAAMLVATLAVAAVRGTAGQDTIDSRAD